MQKKAVLILACCIALLAASSFQAATTNVFESQLNALVNAFSGNFDGIKGDKSYSKDSANVEWKSKVQLTGAAETYIAKNYPADTHLSLIARYKNYTSKEKGVADYKALVGEVKKCKFTLGPVVATEGNEQDKLYTDFQLKSTKGNTAYSSMVIRVKLVNHKYDEGFYFYSLGLIIYKK